MKRRIVALVLACTMGLGMVACGSSDSASDAKSTGSDTIESGAASELVDGKFPETKHITVEVYDRGNDGK